MNTQEVADRLVQLCREGKNVDAINELYDEHIVSREPAGTPMEITEGKEAVRDKTIQWINSVQQVHHESFSDAMVGGDFFSCVMEIDVTYKQHGRMAMTEIAVYEVKNGKIIAEQFF